jgi:hypothetical protein
MSFRQLVIDLWPVRRRTLQRVLPGRPTDLALRGDQACKRDVLLYVSLAFADSLAYGLLFLTTFAPTRYPPQLPCHVCCVYAILTLAP